MADKRLTRWLSHIYETNEAEIDCDYLPTLLPTYIEYELSQLEAIAPISDETLAAIRTHLNHCSDCQDVYQGLREVVFLESAGGLPESDDLLAHFEVEPQSEVAG